MSEKPLVFISCGQFSDEEVSLGKAVEALIRDEEVDRIADNCPDIEEFSVASPALSDFTLQLLSKLKRLRTFNTRLVSISVH